MMSHIFLYGPPGSGKSTVGKMLADKLHWRFIDLDEEIESETGKSISRIMEEYSESGFRHIEAMTLRQRLDGGESVMALGGGTLLRASNRVLVEEQGVVVCLKAEAQTLLERLKDDGSPRPLLAGNTGEKLHSLLAARHIHYGSFQHQVNADQAPGEIIEQLQTELGRFHLSAMGSYDLMLEDGARERLGQILKASAQTILVTDENVGRHYSAQVLNSIHQAGCDARALTIPAGESSKTLGIISNLWRGFLEAGLDRKSTVVALGGGVVGDLVGFAASTFMRSIEWAYVPTTLLAMVDASIGGKTGFDLPEGKNLIGSFHPPRLVLSDPVVLRTLPEAEFRAGFAEVIKHGIVGDPQLFDLCAQGFVNAMQRLPGILRRAVAVKVRIIEADPYERGERAALNLGHTVGHAVEVVSRYTIRHGEAVAMGLVAEARLSERLGLGRSGLSAQIAEALSALGLPVCIPQELPRHELVRAMYVDKKKAHGIVRFALPAEIGRVLVNVEVPDPVLALEEHG